MLIKKRITLQILVLLACTIGCSQSSGGSGGSGTSSNSGSGGNPTTSPAASDWTAATQIPYQGSRLSTTGTSTSLCLRIQGNSSYFTSEMYHNGFLVHENAGGGGSGMNISVTTSMLGNLAYTGILSGNYQTISGTFAQGTPASSGNFSATRRSGQASCNWLMQGSSALDFDANWDVKSVSVAVDPNARPIVAWSEESSASGTWRAHVYVARFSAGTISRLGQALDVTSTGQAQFPTIAVSQTDGTVYVAWYESESSNTSKLYVKSFNAGNNTWNLVGSGQLNSATSNGKPRIVADLQGRPIVTWWEYNGSNTAAPLKFYVRRWINNAWQELGPLLGLNSQGASEDIAIDPSTGEPVVLWRDDFGNAYVSRWDGSTWQGMGGNPLNNLSFPDPVSGTMRLAVRQNGSPIAVWQKTALSGTANSVVAQWNSASQQWTTYTTVEPGLGSSSPQIVIAADNNPIVAYKSIVGVRVKKWDGSTWQQMGGTVTPNMYQSTGIALALTTNDIPVTGLLHQNTNNTAQNDLYLLRWDP